MNCASCGKDIPRLYNYGSDSKPTCFDCSSTEVTEKQTSEILQTVDVFINTVFNKDNGKKLEIVRANFAYTAFGVVGIGSAALMIYTLVNDFNLLDLIPLAFLVLFLVPFSGLFIFLGLAQVRATIDLASRQVTVTRRNLAFDKRKATEVFPLESMRINAVCFPDTPTTWMVRAGCGSFAFISKEFYSVPERNAAMLGIMKKIFPELSHGDESWIVEEGNTAYFKELALRKEGDNQAKESC